MCYDIAILNNKELNNLIEDALYKYDRRFLCNIIFELNKHCKAQLMDIIIDYDKKASNAFNVNNVSEKKDLLKLYWMHADYELKTKKVALQIKHLQKKIREIEEATYTKLTSLNASSQIIDYLKLQQKEQGFVKGIGHVQKTINAMQESNGKQVSLLVFKEKISNLEEDITSRVSSIDHKRNAFKELFESIKENRNRTRTLSRKLGIFTQDLKWTLPLISNLASVEIQTFMKFPLEYNRRAVGGIKGVLYRDLSIDCIPSLEDLDPNSLYILAALLENPCSPAETLLMEIVRGKMKMNQYESLRYVAESLEIKGYNLDQLKQQESYIIYASERLNSLIRRASSAEATNLEKHVKEVVHLWMEMPLKNFISSKRLFNGLSYEHYEKLYENFYSQL